MMGYLSLLVEAGEFDEIHMNYLIVGHTHSLIDQFFSTLSKAIRNADFIGSPLALRDLLNEKVPGRIAVIRPISVFYDFPSAITPFLNTSIKVSAYYFAIVIIISSLIITYCLFFLLYYSIFRFHIALNFLESLDRSV